MAVIFRQSPVGQLAQLLGNVGSESLGLYGKYRKKRETERLLEDEDLPKELATQDPRIIQAIIKSRGLKQKAAQQEAGIQQSTQFASDQIKRAEQLLETEEETKDWVDRLGERAAKKFLGKRPETEAQLDGILQGLYKNPLLSKSDIARVKGADGPAAIRSVLDEAKNLLRIEDPSPQGDETPTSPVDIQQGQIKAQGSEINEFAEEGPEQQAAGVEVSTPTEQEEVVEDVQAQPQDIQAQQEQEEQPQEREADVTDLPRAGLAGIAGGGRTLGELGGLFQRGLQAAGGAILPERLQKQYQEATQRSQEQSREAINKIPARESIFKALGGKEYSSNFGKAVQEFTGDVGELVGLRLLTGGIKDIASFVNYTSKVQGAANTAKWLAKETGLKEDKANAIKTGVGLIASFGLAPKLKDVAEKTIQTAEQSLPPTLLVKDQERIKTLFQGVANRAQQAESGFTGNPDIFNPFFGDRVTYKNALNTISQLRTQGNPSPVMKRAINAIHGIVKRDMQENAQVPKKSIELFSKFGDMWSQYKNADKASNFIQGIPRLNRLIGKGGLGGLGLYALVSSPVYAAAATGAFAVNKLFEFGNAVKLFATSPGMREYYTKMLSAAATQNVPETVKYAEKLDKALRQKQKKR